MKRRPILFSGEMVKAILDGRKTMTRRVVKHQDCVEFDKEGAIYVHHYKCPSYCEFGCNGVGFGESPYGLKGDHLWVRETHAQDSAGILYYKADGLLHPPNEIINDKGKEVPTYWRSSIHMFRWASRITLEITNVRVERLQDITEEDCLKEGINPDVIMNSTEDVRRGRFAALWDSINGKKYPWASNPWVWVIEFKRVI